MIAAGGLLTTSVSATEFPLLPALQSDLAAESLLLDVAQHGDRLLVGGELGHILYSDDDGETWTQAAVPVSLAITSVAFADDRHAWATAHDGYLLHSADGGATWEVRLTGADIARLSVGAIERQIEGLRAALETVAPEDREEAEWALDDAVFALEEATLAIDDGMTSPMLKVWFIDASVGYALGAYNVFLRTADGGKTWVYDSNLLDNPDKYHLYGITRSAAGTLLLAGEAGTLLRSLDDGATWERIESPYPGSFFGAVATGDGGLLVFGLRGNVFRSADEGASWVAVDTGDLRTLMCGTTTADGGVVLAGSAGVVLRSNDAGKTFNVAPIGENQVFSDVIVTAAGRTLLVGFGGVLVADGGSNDE
jgi:photosystem II stability/assembly factor-like uncharacterized protein